ncbi:UNVERIFIED_CONTAM: hypothetical protein GTU68_000361 [Idotea baltica]|nr:hypothetical protein [Idotea baltica]
MKNKLTSASKFLSLVLRHKPETIDAALDEHGWLEISTLINNANKIGNSITLELLHEVVATSDKRRFMLSEDGLKIRANQGHSIENVDLQLEPSTPPEVLYHGTVAQFIASIRAKGLQKRSRNHVHLSSDLDTASKVGMRRGKPVVLAIACDQMHKAGHQFFQSANGVWLTKTVPVEFIEFP